jgi:hypothetical protein
MLRVFNKLVMLSVVVVVPCLLPDEEVGQFMVLQLNGPYFEPLIRKEVLLKINSIQLITPLTIKITKSILIC